MRTILNIHTNTPSGISAQILDHMRNIADVADLHGKSCQYAAVGLLVMPIARLLKYAKQNTQHLLLPDRT